MLFKTNILVVLSVMRSMDPFLLDGFIGCLASYDYAFNIDGNSTFNHVGLLEELSTKL